MFFLILKKTSSAVDVTTYKSKTIGEKDARLGQNICAFIGQIEPLTSRKSEHTLMLIGPFSSCFGAASWGWGWSLSDMTWEVTNGVGEVKYQGTPSATAMVAEGERRIGLRGTLK